MYTEEDLRVTLGALEREAPDAARVLTSLARAQRRRTVRRRVAGVVAAAAVAVVMAGGSVLVGNLASPSGTNAALPPVNPMRYPFAVDESAGFQVNYEDSRFAGGSDASIGVTGTDSGPQYPYRLEVLETGRYHPPANQNAEPVRVNGMTGFYRPDFQYQYDEENTNGVPGVAWEYAQDSWATLRYQPTEPGLVPPPDVRETLLRMAEAVRFDRTTPVRLPFQVGYLPAGIQPAEDFPADMGAGPNHTNAMIAFVGDAGSLSIALVDVSYSPSRPGDMDVHETQDHITFVTVNLGQFELQVTGHGFSVDEVKRVAQSLSPAADLHDEDTWFDAERALPLH